MTNLECTSLPRSREYPANVSQWSFDTPRASVHRTIGGTAFHEMRLEANESHKLRALGTHGPLLVAVQPFEVHHVDQPHPRGKPVCIGLKVCRHQASPHSAEWIIRRGWRRLGSFG